MQFIFAEYRMYLSNARWFTKLFNKWTALCNAGNLLALAQDESYLKDHAQHWRSRAMEVKDIIRKETNGNTCTRSNL